MSAFDLLNVLNINDHTETKNVGGTELTYLSWPWAWAEVKKRFPDACYTIWRDENGIPYSYDPKTGYMVYTSVTIEGITHDMWLPVMDGANKAMKDHLYEYKVKNPKFKYAKKQADGRYLDSYGNEQPEFFMKTVEAASMMDVNKAIMRCLVKNLAMFGLGLYIYAGEDLPENNDVPNNQRTENTIPTDNADDIKKTVNQSASVNTAPVIPNTKQYIKKELATMAEVFGLSSDEMMKRFVQMRKELIEKKVIPDVASEKQTIEQAQAMIDAIYKNYKPSGDAA